MSVDGDLSRQSARTLRNALKAGGAGDDLHRAKAAIFGHHNQIVYQHAGDDSSLDAQVTQEPEWRELAVSLAAALRTALEERPVVGTPAARKRLRSAARKLGEAQTPEETRKSLETIRGIANKVITSAAGSGTWQGIVALAGELHESLPSFLE